LHDPNGEHTEKSELQDHSSGTCYIGRRTTVMTHTQVHRYWLYACVVASQRQRFCPQFSQYLYLICQTMFLITTQLIHNGNVSPKNYVPEFTIFQSSTHSGIASIKCISLKVSCNYCHEIILRIINTFPSYIII
jgi:hypothetical protein